MNITENRVILGDSMGIIGDLPGCFVDFLYLDPPFYTNRVHKYKKHESEFSDCWEGGLEEYLGWLEERVGGMKRLLKPTGAFVLHLDWHAVHYAKVMCDRIFGYDNFQNEIIWHYQTGGASKERFSRKHDTLLLYSVGEDFYFNGKAIAIPRTAKAMKRAKCPTGARIAVTDTHKNPEDVLTIPALNPMATERNGYPTQKPVELLTTLISALCPEGGMVGDFCCGSGTTLVAAKKLGRRYIGCDVSEKAVALARKRLEEIGEK